MKLRDRRSILGIDPTKKGLAFVFFERGELVDWGQRYCGSRIKDELALLDLLLNTSGANVLVLENPNARGCCRRARIRELLRAAVELAKSRRVAIVRVSRRDVRALWRSRGHPTKQAVATFVAAQYLPELRHLVPPPRKLFMDEDLRLKVFDALTLVLAASDLRVGR